MHEEIRRFLRRLGYRLILRAWEHPSQATAGSLLTIRMTWQNVGSAPCYIPYPAAIRLRNQRGQSYVHVTEFTVNRLMPGNVVPFTEDFMAEPPELPPGEPVTAEATLRIPRTLPRGEYSVALAVLDENRQTPVVRLAIAGREGDGWYPLSRIVIRNR